MSVLARDIAAYQTAVDQYRRQLGNYNAQINAYNNTVVSQNGQPLVVYGGLVYTVNTDGTLGQAVGVMGGGSGTPIPAPSGGQVYDYSQYGLTPIDGAQDFSLLRQNPTSTTQETTGNVYQNEAGYYTIGSQGEFQYLGPEWSVTGTPTQDGTGNTVYTLTRNVYAFADKPADFTGELKAKRPDPTQAQMRKLWEPKLVDQERGGLINDVIRSGGLKAGGSGRTRAGAPTDVPADPPPTDPIGTDPIDWSQFGTTPPTGA